MRARLYFFGVIILAGLFAPCTTHAVDAQRPTYVIPIEGMIERGLQYAVRRGLQEAKENNAGA
ncbi:MAG: nodulation protein NfeD, partial [Verrucomicrobia bacterium]|nr:nodulation protein NfeD [Verrucomicrobiota bacterium]